MEIVHVPAIRFLLDTLEATTLLARGPAALADTTADDAFPFRGSGGWFGFLGGCVGAAGRGFGALAGIDFGFHGGGFLFDDAETAFD